jgi:phage/plasmid primase-like uncharacterized protein
MIQYTRDGSTGRTFLITASNDAEAEWLAHVLSPPPVEQTTDLGDLTARKAVRAALKAQWAALRDAYDAQEEIARSGDRTETAKLHVLKQQVDAAYRRLQETEGG